LWGTLLFDYETEEDYKASLSPKLVVEVLGVSEWDGKGRANNYPGGFLLVTHTGGTYYVSVNSQHERDEWILHLRQSLECVFANAAVAPFKPSKIIQNRPSPIGNHTCPKAHTALSAYSPMCPSCGRGFYSTEYLAESTVLLQLGSEEAEKVCLDCKSSQMIILWLKIINYVHTMDLHEHTLTVLQDISKYKSSFRIRRRISQRLDMAAQLFESGAITAEEFEELRIVDHAYRREIQYEECSKLRIAIETFGEDMQTIINILMDNNLTSKGGRNAALKIIIRILELADSAPDLIDFYFPQLYQVHLIQCCRLTSDSLTKLDLIQQMLLVLSQKYPSFGLKLTWSLLASIGDFQEKKITQIQYAACICLLLQLEMVISGVISSIADVPVCRLLQRVLHPSRHQQQEVACELSSLFLIRRKLQEAYDEDDRDRIARNMKVYGPKNEIHATNMNSDHDIKEERHKMVPIFPGSNRDCSCIELLYSLGVGQSMEKEKRRRKKKVKQQPRQEGEEGEKGSSSSSSSSIHETDDDEEEWEEVEEAEEKKAPVLHYWDGFSEQLDFIDRLNDLVESLRFIDRPARTDALKKQLTKWNNAHKHPVVNRNNVSSPSSRNPSTTNDKKEKLDELNENIMENPMLGWDPTIIAGEPHYRITRIIVEECRVFRTKARAPSLIVCEVMRDDLYSKYFYSHNEQLHVLEESLTSSSNRSNRDRDRDNEAEEEDSQKEQHQHQSQSEPLVKTPHRSVVRSRARSNSMVPTPREGGKEGKHDLATEKDGDKTFESISQSIKDVDSLVISSETLAGLHSKIAERMAADQSAHHDISTDPEKAALHNKELMMAALEGSEVSQDNGGEGGKFFEIDRKDHNNRSASATDRPTYAQIAGGNDGSNDHQQQQHQRSMSTVERKGSWQLPRWKGSSFLASNRLSSSTQGILKSSQVSYPNVDSKSKHHADHINLDHVKTVIHNQGTHNKINMIKHSTSSNTLQQSILASGSSSSSVGYSPPPSPFRPAVPSNDSEVHSNEVSNKSNQSSPAKPVQSSEEGSTNNQNDASLPPLSVTLPPSSNATSPRPPGSSLSSSQKTSDSPSVNQVPTQEVVISSAQRLLMDGAISQKEYEQLVASDQYYRDETARDEAVVAKHRVESSFGETFQSKKERILGDKLDFIAPATMIVSSAIGAYGPRERALSKEKEKVDGRSVLDDSEYWPAYDLKSFIVKTNDDLRQEIACIQIMQICKEIFDHFGLGHMLYLRPYRILCTGSNAGIVEVLSDSISLDALKKTSGFTSLTNYFNKTYCVSPERLMLAKYNFMASLAAYSLYSYILLIKDRHNGNLLIDHEGHILHIDFGFLLSIAPGGSFSVETAPFKLTEEMVELMGGLDSPLFGEFVTAFTKGFIALQANCENIISAITLLSINSTFPCFQGKSAQQILEKLKNRFRSELNVKDAVKHCLDLITNSYGHYGTRQYDTFQYYTNGILP
jgi:hypothetical protein